MNKLKDLSDKMFSKFVKPKPIQTVVSTSQNNTTISPSVVSTSQNNTTISPSGYNPLDCKPPDTNLKRKSITEYI